MISIELEQLIVAGSPRTEDRSSDSGHRRRTRSEPIGGDAIVEKAIIGSLKAYFAKAGRLVRSNNNPRGRRNGGSSRGRSSVSDAALSIMSESGSHGDGKGRRSRIAAHSWAMALS